MTDNVHPFPRSAPPPLLGLSQRQPPCNPAAEQSLLGAILANNRAFHLVSDFLRPEHFSDSLHQRLFRELGRRILDGGTPDAVSLKTWMESDPDSAEVGGGSAYLAMLLTAVVGIIDAAEYGRAIHDAFLRREMIAIGEHAVDAAFDSEKPTGDTAAEVAAQLDRLLASGSTDQPGVEWNEALERTMSAIDLAASGAGITGVSTGMASVDDALGGLDPGTLNILGGRPGMGKEQPVDAPVLTPLGWAPMGSLHVGDLVIGSNGTSTRVIGVHPQGVRQAFRVSFRDGTSAECGADHIWSVAESGGRSRHKFCPRPLRDIVEKGVTFKKDGRIGVRWRVPLVAPIQFAEKSLPVDPYVLGVLIGDGALSGNGIRFSNPDFDSDIRSAVAERLGQHVSLTENRSGACPYFDIRGSGRKDLCAAIKSLGLDIKSKIKFLPEIYLLSSVDQRIDLLRGLMDTDGSCLANRTVFYTTSPRLSLDVAALVRSLGGVAIIRSYDRSRDGKPTEHCVNVRVDFCPFLTFRKAAHWAPRPPSRYMVGVVPSRMVEQVCISVDAPDGLYLTSDYLVTHNSAIALQWAVAAARAGQGVCIFSLEMSATALTRRAIAAASGVSVTKLRRGWINNVEGAIVAAHKGLMGLPITIEDAAGLSVGSVLLRARKARRKQGTLGLIVVDHLHIVEPDSGDVKQGATWAVGRVSKALHAMAKSLHVPVLALAQLSRAVEGRDDKRPTKSDLRMSGDIEQNAETITFIYRPEYYLPKSEPEKGPTESAEKFDARLRAFHYEKERLRGKAELILAKVRDGEESIVPLRWHGETTSFSEASE